MAEDDNTGQGKWDHVSKVIGKYSTVPAASRAKAGGVLQKHQAIDVPHESIQKPQGTIAQFKASKIGKKAALRQIEVWYEGQLEATKHAVHEAVRVRKAEASRIAERLLMEIDAEHLQYLFTLGLRNEKTRGQAMIELNEQTSKLLKEVEGRDWPPELIEQSMHGILERHRLFFQKIMEELGAT